jgi:superfamily II helicase
MDRVVCGDVGFGKTEVAMRAAFVAVQGGRQVAVLVPTTLLAQQHFENFTDRFADWPVRVESLSRFRTAKEQKTVIGGLERGVIDIVVRIIRDHVFDYKWRQDSLCLNAGRSDAQTSSSGTGRNSSNGLSGAEVNPRRR